MIRSFGLYLFAHEMRGTDPRNPPSVRRCATTRQRGQWFEDFAHAAKAARLGVK